MYLRAAFWIHLSPSRAYDVIDYSSNTSIPTEIPGGTQPSDIWKLYGATIVWGGHLWYVIDEGHITWGQVTTNWAAIKPPEDIHPDENTWHTIFNDRWALAPRPWRYHDWDKNAPRYIADQDADGNFPYTDSDEFEFKAFWPTHRWLPRDVDPNEQLRPVDENTLQFDNHGVEFIKEIITIIGEFGPQHGPSQFPFEIPRHTEEYLFEGTPGIDEITPGPMPDNPDAHRQYEPNYNAGYQNQLFLLCARTGQLYMYKADDHNGATGYKARAIVWHKYYKVCQLFDNTDPQPPNVDGDTWTAQAYDRLRVVAKDWEAYWANENALAGDVPGVSSKWTQFYHEWDDLTVEEHSAWTAGNDEHWGNNGSQFELLLMLIGEWDWYFDTNTFIPKGILRQRALVGELAVAQAKYTAEEIADAQETSFPTPVGTWRKMPRYTFGKKDIMWPKEKGTPPGDTWQAKWPNFDGPPITYFDIPAPFSGIYVSQVPDFELTDEEQADIDARHGAAPGSGPEEAYEKVADLLNDMKEMLDLQLNVLHGFSIDGDDMRVYYQDDDGSEYRLTTNPTQGPVNTALSAFLAADSALDYDGDDIYWHDTFDTIIENLSVLNGNPTEEGLGTPFIPVGFTKHGIQGFGSDFIGRLYLCFGAFHIASGKLLGIYDADEILCKVKIWPCYTQEDEDYSTAATHDTNSILQIAIDGQDNTIDIPLSTFGPVKEGPWNFHWLNCPLDSNDETGEVTSPLIYIRVAGKDIDIAKTTQIDYGNACGAAVYPEAELILKIDWTAIPDVAWEIDYTNHLPPGP